MTPERWQKINEVFQSVVELETEDRRAYLDRACDGDESLRGQVETLLAANEDAGTFMAGNAAEDVGHLLEDDSRTLSGQSLGHYDIISELGSGGMGRVYLAHDSKLNRPIAVKTLPVSFSGKEDYVKRFQTEAKAAATLNHPNIATVFSVEETDEHNLFITMEYVEGKSLNRMIPSGGLDLRTFLEWFISIADALAHAHAKGIVHRDIKPGNIMITQAGNPKILDFGLARIDKTTELHEDSTLTKPGQVLGTPAYMSPEQAEGKQTDYRTDIFSLGVLMYECITGRKPFTGDNYASVVSALLTKDPQNIAEIKPDVPYLLSRLIMKCLRKESRYRYQSMDEVRVILTEIESAFGSGASLASSGTYPLSKPSGVSPNLLYAAFGVIALLALFAGWTWFSRSTNDDKLVQRFSIHSERPTNISVLDAKISPDGKNLILNDSSSREDHLYIRSLDSFEIRLLEGTDDHEVPFFSPDGTWVGYTTRSDKIKKIPIEGGTPVTICEACPSIRSGHWGDDGWIYYSSNKGLQRVSSDGGKPEELTQVDSEKGENNHYMPQLLPDRETVLFSIGRSDHPKLAILSLADNKWSYIEEAGKAWFGKYVSTGHIIFARGKQLMVLPFDLGTRNVTGKATFALPDLFAMAPNIEISENGTLIYLPTISRTDNQVVWVDRFGNATPAIEEKGDFNAPRLSPDGSRIAVERDDDIWVYELRTGGKIRITSDGKNEIPIWSRDGKWIYYGSEKDTVFAVHRKSANGTGEAEEITSGKYRLRPYSISPDNVLTVAANNKEGIVIEALTLEDKKRRVIIGTKYREDTPRFSPDGKWLAYFFDGNGEPADLCASLERFRTKDRRNEGRWNVSCLVSDGQRDLLPSRQPYLFDGHRYVQRLFCLKPKTGASGTLPDLL